MSIQPVDPKPGDRVGAIQKADKDTVYFYGYGIYDGDLAKEILDNGIVIDNPRITLDDGNVVWGCECWWGPEESIKKSIGNRKIVMVSINSQKGTK